MSGSKVQNDNIKKKSSKNCPNQSVFIDFLILNFSISRISNSYKDLLLQYKKCHRANKFYWKFDNTFADLSIRQERSEISELIIVSLILKCLRCRLIADKVSVFNVHSD